MPPARDPAHLWDMLDACRNAMAFVEDGSLEIFLQGLAASA